MTSEPGWRQVGGTAAEIYERWLVPGMFAPWVPRLIELAGVQPGERILDVACGTGVVARLAAVQTGSDGQVVGLDLNPSMLAVARSLPPVAGAAITWVEASALAMPLPDAAFDVVLCQHGLQQFPDRPAALREMRRVLSPAGRLALSVWAPLAANPGMAALVEALERHVGGTAADNRRAPFALSDAGQVGELLRDAGFREVQVQTVVATARFPSPEDFVAAQLAATPLSTVEGLSAAQEAIASDVRMALRAYAGEHELALPMTAHFGLGYA